MKMIFASVLLFASLSQTVVASSANSSTQKTQFCETYEWPCPRW